MFSTDKGDIPLIQTQFNTNKCKILTVTNKKNITKHQCKMEKSKLKNVKQEKYLAAINNRLSWLPLAKRISCFANLKRQLLQPNLGKCNRDIKRRC